VLFASTQSRESKQVFSISLEGRSGPMPSKPRKKINFGLI
jgi:hypothetical protein